MLNATASAEHALGIVVSTIGRVPELLRLIHTLAPALGGRDAIAVCFQGDGPLPDDELHSLRRTGIDLRWTSRGGGLSRGRNAAAELLADRERLLLFPNDNSILQQRTLSHIRSIGSEIRIGAMPRVSADSPEVEPSGWPREGTPLDRVNVWRAAEPGFVVSSALLLELGGWNESIGTGCNTPWQASEGTDLLLTALSRGLADRFVWFQAADAAVTATDSRHIISLEETYRKARAYGRGYGYVVRKWQYPLWFKFRLLTAAATLHLRRRQHGYTARESWETFLGRLEGLLQCTLSRPNMKAVNR